MDLTEPNVLNRLRYAEVAETYLRALPIEHFMEATAQPTQRKITLESFDLIHAARPEVQIFNELLVQYPKGKKIRGEVPDNMVVIHLEPIDADGSFDVIFQPAQPIMVMEYVSKHNKRKDYDDNMERYEKDLKVPYYLLFYPDSLDLNLYHLRRKKYSSVRANARERHEAPELELEVALLDGWARYWFRGKLVPLPGEMARQLSAAEDRAKAAEAELERIRAELERIRAELERIRPNGHKK